MIGRNLAPLRTDGPRFNEHYLHAEGVHLNAKGVAEGLYGKLGHIVPAAKVEDGLARNGTDIDDSAVSALPHAGKHQLAEPGQAEKIHLQLPSGILHGNGFNGAEVSVAGIVHQHVHGTYGGQAGLQGFFRGDVQGNGDDSIGLQGFHQGHAPRSSVYLVSKLGKGPGGFKTDSAAGACN